MNYSDEWLTILGGDCREVLRTLPASSVHCVITSPPYWGLRDYGTASWAGGDEGCDHRGTSSGTVGSSSKSTLTTGSRNGDWAPGNTIQTLGRGDCVICGATRQDSQLGLEATPEEYVATMVDVFREVRRVLRDDGTLWLNLGDSYAGSGKGGNPEGSQWSGFVGSNGREKAAKASPPYLGLAQKQLVGIPWRVAFALQADGWYLRSDIIWSKPNPMPESVTDRPTKSHEYLFLLSKSPRYYFDADAVREALDRPELVGRTRLSGVAGLVGQRGDVGRQHEYANPAGRNIRSVWTIATAPYPGAHFATFPPKLVEPCVKAGTSERGVCSECGAPWERVVERATGGPKFAPLAIEQAGVLPDGPGTHRNMGGRYQKWLDENRPQTTGWRPTCKHDAEPVPAVVMDLFAGTGTVGMVAQSLSRRAVLIDLNPDYLRQCLSRNAQTPLGLAT